MSKTVSLNQINKITGDIWDLSCRQNLNVNATRTQTAINELYADISSIDKTPIASIYTKCE